jgi:hypothetical protein
MGPQAHYELRLPLYEMPHVANAAQSLFAHIVFSSGGRPAQLSRSRAARMPRMVPMCVRRITNSPRRSIRLDVECTFHAVTVPNHVHLLRVENGGKRDQALFDISFPPQRCASGRPRLLETAIAQAGGGALRACGGAAQILFLASLVLAARSRRELILLTVMFLAGQTAAALIVPLTAWQPPARFVEAAAGLTIAYLAVEILALPKAGMRWLIVAVLGAFHGLYFELFSAYHRLPGCLRVDRRGVRGDRANRRLRSDLLVSGKAFGGIEARSRVRFRLIGYRHGLVLPAFAKLRREANSGKPETAPEWSQCSAVESIAGEAGGAWVLRGTRMPVSAIFENPEAGADARSGATI